MSSLLINNERQNERNTISNEFEKLNLILHQE